MRSVGKYIILFCIGSVLSHYFDDPDNIAWAKVVLRNLAPQVGPNGQVTPDNTIDDCNVRGRSFIRFAWHDAATMNVSDCSGGLDGSILYEGDFSDNTPTPGWAAFVADIRAANTATCGDDDTCYADLIVLAATMALEGCGGPSINFQYGRIDATESNGDIDALIPGETESVAEIEVKFARMGIDNPHDILALIAGGHTNGRHATPDPSRNPPPGVNPLFPLPDGCSLPAGTRSLPFDTTETKFDTVYFADVLEFVSGGYGDLCPVSHGIIVLPVEQELYATTPYSNIAAGWNSTTNGNDHSSHSSSGRNSFVNTFKQSYEYLLNWNLYPCHGN
jgi:hypothetical protein